jgi:hypothetical protein
VNSPLIRPAGHLLPALRPGRRAGRGAKGNAPPVRRKEDVSCVPTVGEHPGTQKANAHPPHPFHADCMRSTSPRVATGETRRTRGEGERTTCAEEGGCVVRAHCRRAPGHAESQRAPPASLPRGSHAFPFSPRPRSLCPSRRGEKVAGRPDEGPRAQLTRRRTPCRSSIHSSFESTPAATGPRAANPKRVTWTRGSGKPHPCCRIISSTAFASR